MCYLILLKALEVNTGAGQGLQDKLLILFVLGV